MVVVESFVVESFVVEWFFKQGFVSQSFCISRVFILSSLSGKGDHGRPTE